MSRSTITQMQSALTTLVDMRASDRLHQCKALKLSESQLLGHQIKDARDFVAALARHPELVQAILRGEKLVPASMAIHAAQQMANEGME
jgi:hypothetical protein